MTSYYKKPTISTKHGELNFLNTCVSVHDLHCYCDTPLQHLIGTIIEREPNIKFDKATSEKLQKCLTTGDADVLDDFGDGELENLFAEDFPDGDAAGDDDR